MRIYDLLETLNLDYPNLSEQQIWQVYEEYNTKQWIDATHRYLKELDRYHQVPGKVIHTLWGVCDYYREHQELTAKQAVYLVANLVRYWDQMSCLGRSQIYF